MKCENVEVLPIAKSNSNWKLATLELAILASMATCAKTFDVDISTGRPAASNEAYYHGETIEFPSGMKEMGPVLTKLYNTLRGIQLGTVEAPEEGWIREIK